jgi:hypothetical protein
MVPPTVPEPSHKKRVLRCVKNLKEAQSKHKLDPTPFTGNLLRKAQDAYEAESRAWARIQCGYPHPCDHCVPFKPCIEETDKEFGVHRGARNTPVAGAKLSCAVPRVDRLMFHPHGHDAYRQDPDHPEARSWKDVTFPDNTPENQPPPDIP